MLDKAFVVVVQLTVFHRSLVVAGWDHRQQMLRDVNWSNDHWCRWRMCWLMQRTVRLQSIAATHNLTVQFATVA